jgi:uncharacterized protein (TIGR01777 family)
MRILITGGTGFIGQELQAYLHALGHQTRILSRKDGWDIAKGYLAEDAFENIDAIVHLAGAGIADKRWSEARKRELIHSRVASTALLAEALKTRKHQVRTFVSASAIGYYGADSGEVLCKEDTPAGHDFLSTCTVAWEQAVDEVPVYRVVKLRIGLVLGAHGGIFPVLARPIRWFAGVILGRGTQGQSWIHIQDLVKMFACVLTDESAKGVYNAVAPEPVTHAEMTKQIAAVYHRPVWWPKVPAWALRLVLGEMAALVTGGNFVSSEKIQKELHFSFTYTRLKDALTQILHV